MIHNAETIAHEIVRRWSADGPNRTVIHHDRCRCGWEAYSERLSILEPLTTAHIDGAAKPPLSGGERSYPNPCGVVLGQQKGVGPGLFISCQNERPCPDHPSDIDGSDG